MAQSFFIPISNEQRVSATLNKALGTDEEDSPVEDKTLVIMVHGFPGHKSAQNDIFGDIEFQLTRDGFHTLRFDFRGSGESDGKAEDFTFASAAEDMSAIIAWAQSFGYTSFFYIGEGLGAMLALESLNPHVRGAVMLWPAFDPRLTNMKAVLDAAKTDEAKAQGYVVWKDTKIGLPFIANLKSFNPLRKLRSLRIPLLIQQGAADEEISPMQMELLRRHARSLRRIELTTYEGGGHGLHRLNERQTMFYHIKQFLKRYG